VSAPPAHRAPDPPRPPLPNPERRRSRVRLLRGAAIFRATGLRLGRISVCAAAGGAGFGSTHVEAGVPETGPPGPRRPRSEGDVGKGPLPMDGLRRLPRGLFHESAAFALTRVTFLLYLSADLSTRGAFLFTFLARQHQHDFLPVFETLNIKK